MCKLSKYVDSIWKWVRSRILLSMDIGRRIWDIFKREFHEDIFVHKAFHYNAPLLGVGGYILVSAMVVWL